MGISKVHLYLKEKLFLLKQKYPFLLIEVNFAKSVSYVSKQPLYIDWTSWKLLHFVVCIRPISGNFIERVAFLKGASIFLKHSITGIGKCKGKFFSDFILQYRYAKRLINHQFFYSIILVPFEYVTFMFLSQHNFPLIGFE